MAAAGIPKARLTKELKLLRSNPPDGVLCWPRHGSDSDAPSFDQDGGFLLDVSMTGPAGTPYEGGTFHLACRLPPNYPVAPPHVKFVTRVYHPNMDRDGRICIPVLKEGSDPDRWNAVKCNIRSALALIRQLLAEPNPEDPLDADAASLMKQDPVGFQRKAKKWTILYATGDQVTAVAESDVQGTSSLAAQESKPKASLLGQPTATSAATAAGPAHPLVSTLCSSMGGSLSSSAPKHGTMGPGLLSLCGNTGGFLGGGSKSSLFAAGTRAVGLIGRSFTPTGPSPPNPAGETRSSANPPSTGSRSSTPVSDIPAATDPLKPTLAPSSKRSRDPAPSAPAATPPAAAPTSIPSSLPPRSSAPTDERPAKKLRHASDTSPSPRTTSPSTEKKYKAASAAPSPAPSPSLSLSQANEHEQNDDEVVVVSSSSSSLPPPQPSPKPAKSTPSPLPVSEAPGQASQPAAPLFAPQTSLLARTSLLGTNNPPPRTTFGGGGLLGSAGKANLSGGGLLGSRGANSGSAGGLFGSGGGTRPSLGGGLLARASGMAANGPVGTGPRIGLLGSGGLLGAAAAKQPGVAGGSIFGGKSGLFSKKSSS